MRCCFALLCCFACGCYEVKEKVWYDAVSHRIELRHGGRTTSVLQEGIGFAPESARWKEGFSFAFPRTLTSSRILKIKTATGRIYSVRMKPTIDEKTRGIRYHFKVTDEATGRSLTSIHDAMQGSKFALPDGSEVRWSLKSSREVLIYSDNFLVKPLSQCWSAIIEDESNAAATKSEAFCRFPWEMESDS